MENSVNWWGIIRQRFDGSFVAEVDGLVMAYDFKYDMNPTKFEPNQQVFVTPYFGKRSATLCTVVGVVDSSLGAIGQRTFASEIWKMAMLPVSEERQGTLLDPT